MFKLGIVIALTMLAMFIVGVSITNGQESGQKSSQPAVPPTGAPEQMQKLSNLPGTWDVAQQWKIGPQDTTWQTSTATAVFKYILDSCAMEMTFKGDMMGKPYQALGLTAYDRETGKWQGVYVDDMGAVLVYYQGDYTNGKLSVTGEEKWNGQTFLSRISIYNLTPQKFDWMYEMSTDGGKTCVEMGKAVYTKKA